MYHMQFNSPGSQLMGQYEGMVPGMEGQIPPLDVVETKGEVIYIIDVPGSDSNLINVEIKNDTLMVEGKIDFGLGAPEDIHYLYRERYRNYGYKRVMLIPPEVQKEQVQANVRNGILTVRFPKTHESRRINVNQHHTNQPPTHQ